MQSSDSLDTGASAQPRSSVKRKRVVLSCLECKRRKLKCDRQVPICTRCTEVGHPDLCKYDDRLLGSDEHEPDIPSTTGTTFRNASGISLFEASASHDAHRIRQLERHVANLEARLAHTTSSRNALPPTPNSHAAPLHEASINDSGDHVKGCALVRGRGFKTRYRGPSNPASVLCYFPTVYNTLKQLSRDIPTLGVYKRTIQSFERTRPPDPVLSPETIHDTLQQLVPSEALCRHYMRLYFRSFESIYRILHAKTFWGQFNKFWSRELVDPSSFRAVLLAAMSCARCLVPDDPVSFDGSSTTSVVEAGQWIRAAETYHSFQSHKHTTITSFQLPCLLLLSKRVNEIKVKRHFVMSQTLVATAMSAGFHQSPSSMGHRMTVYEQEMRRRLWATMTELEASCSIEWGMPSYTSSLLAECEVPGNLQDDDFDEDATGHLPERVDDVFTDCSFQIFSHDLKQLRNAVSSIANSVNAQRTASYAETLSYHQLITSKFAAIPSWTTPGMSEDEADRVLFVKSYIKLQLYELLIILHLPLAFGVGSDPNKNHSRFVCMDAARSTIEIYERLSQHGYSQMTLLKNNLGRASLCVCLLQVRSVDDDLPIWPTSTEPSTDPVEKAMNLFEARVLCLGSGVKELWILLGASTLMATHQTPSALPVWQKKVTDRISALLSRVYLCQKSKGGDVPGAHVLGPAGAGGGQAGAVGQKNAEQDVDLGMGSLATPVSGFDLPAGLEPEAWTDWMLDDLNLYNFS